MRLYWITAVLFLGMIIDDFIIMDNCTKSGNAKLLIHKTSISCTVNVEK